MQPQFNDHTIASLFLWGENRLASLGQAYINATLPFFPTSDPALPAGYSSYNSPFKGFVYDSSVSGAIIVHSVSGGSDVLTRASGIYIDYGNGRVIVPTALATYPQLTGTVSIKEINTYLSNEDEEALLTQSKNYFNPRYSNIPWSGLPPYVKCTPALYVNTLHASTDAFAFGGLVDTNITFSFLLFAESNFQLNSVISLFNDARFQYVPLVPITADPIDALFGDLVSGQSYNYQTYIGQYGSPGQLIYIKNVAISKVSDKVKLNPNLFVALIDLQVGYVRSNVL